RLILADIRRDEQRAGKVIERMRAFMKRRSLEAVPLDLRELLEEVVALARPDALARHVHLILHVPIRLPQVRGEKVHLQQVLLNLILNGMDSMSDSPDSARLLVIRASNGANGSIEVGVTDRGAGIGPDEANKIFEPFFTTKPNGMGMGLAISRTIIEAHGGKIRAENNSDGGATFTFTLPIIETK